MGFISFSVKAAIATSAVYWTYENKVWGTSRQSDDLYNKLVHEAQPTLKAVRKQIPIATPLLPSTGEAAFLAKHYYNNGVKNTIYFIHRLPCYLGQWAQKAQSGVKSILEPAVPAKE